MKKMFGTLEMVADFFLGSPKRMGALESVIDNDAVDNNSSALHQHRRLKRLCPTRWVERHNAVSVFLELLRHIVTTLDRIIHDGDLRSSGKHSRDLLSPQHFHSFL